MTKVLIIVRSSRTVDDDTAEDTIPCLDGEVRVIPGAAVLSRSPLVRLGVTGSDWALSDGGDTVHLLKQSMVSELGFT